MNKKLEFLASLFEVKIYSPRVLPPGWSIILIAAILAFAALSSGCAGLQDPAKPRNEAEMFPQRNQDPRVGLIVNTGTAPMNLYVYDQANRLVEQIYLSGAERHIVSANGQPYPQYWMRKFEQGCYRVDATPFYHAVRLMPPAKYRVDLPRQTTSFCVGNNPTAYYYGGTHWGWLLYVRADIPEGQTGLPLFQVLNPLSQ